MSPEFYTIIGVAIVLAGLIIYRHRSLSASIAQMRTEYREAIGTDKGKIEIFGDIVEPLDVEWEAGNSESGSP